MAPSGFARPSSVKEFDTEVSSTDLYRELVPVLNSRTVELLDHKQLVKELCGLERRVSRSGREIIDHGRSGHDDVANVVAGVVSILGKRKVVWDLLGGPLSREEYAERVAKRPPLRPGELSTDHPGWW